MYKCIYDLTTFDIVAVCSPDQNIQSFISNWTNVDYIEIEEISMNTRDFKYSVDPTTRQLISA